jgi:hypothetical protein
MNLMTIEQFNQKIKKRDKFDNLFNYLICSVFIALGLFLLFKILDDGFNNSISGVERYEMLLLPLICILPGIYGFWRIPKDYKLNSIRSNKTIDEKLKIITEYLSDLKIEQKTVDNNFIECRYENIFLNKVDLRIFIDEQEILFNAQGVDQSGATGIIDFGLTSRATRRLKKYLKANQ